MLLARRLLVPFAIATLVPFGAFAQDEPPADPAEEAMVEGTPEGLPDEAPMAEVPSGEAPMDEASRSNVSSTALGPGPFIPAFSTPG